MAEVKEASWKVEWVIGLKSERVVTTHTRGASHGCQSHGVPVTRGASHTRRFRPRSQTFDLFDGKHQPGYKIEIRTPLMSRHHPHHAQGVTQSEYFLPLSINSTRQEHTVTC